MKHVKKFENNLSDAQKFQFHTFDEAFNTLIKGKKIVAWVDIQPEGTYSYAQGIQVEDGYIYAHHGGGCSGNDCNTTWILTNDGKIISQSDW